FLYAQGGTVTVQGTVIDGETGMPFPGANVIEKGTSNGVLTDFDGRFSIDVPENSTLQVSYLGFATAEYPVTGNMELEVVLEPEASGLDEVVVVGYGTQKKSDLTGAVASVNAEDLEKMPQVDVAQALQGRMAGMTVSFSGSDAEGGAENILI